MPRKRIPCDRGRFGTQAEYEECLEERRVRRNGGSENRFSAALADLADMRDDYGDLETDDED